MYWKLFMVERREDDAAASGPSEGRFVLHRHRDAQGPHLDLRLEQDGYCLGWRVDAETLDAEVWAAEKAPHPAYWLEQDGDAVREDEGTYCWLRRDARGGDLAFHGRNGVRILRAERVDGLPPECVRAVCETLADAGCAPRRAAQLIADGLEARRRALARFIGLGRELDGAGFDEAVWRKTLDPLSLREVFSHLESLEARFDRKYPPEPVSRPERLPEETGKSVGAERALEILWDV